MTLFRHEISGLLMTQAWQITLLIAVTLLITRYLARNRPHLAHVLWVVVLLKCVTPPLWQSPSGIFCWLQPTNTEPAAEEPPRPELIVGTSGLTPDQFPDALKLGPSATQKPGTPFKDISTLNLTAAPGEAVIQPADSFLSIPNLLVVIWLSGGALILGVAGFRWVLCWRKIKRSGTYSVDSLDEVVASLRQRLKISRRVRLLITPSPIGPAVIAWFRPVVLLPELLVQAKSPQELEPVLAHELVHLRRGDLRISLLQMFASALWWFHPMVHWAGRLATRESERCCDEEVIAELGCDPEIYARSLLDVLELKQKLKPVPVVPGVRPMDVTSKRLERIMNHGRFHKRTPWHCWIIMTVAAFAVLPGAAMIVTAGDLQEAKSATNHVGQDTNQKPIKTPQDNTANAPALERPLVVTTYDVRDFVKLIRKQSFAVVPPKSDKGTVENQPVSVDKALKMLTRLIKISVEPQSWQARNAPEPALGTCSISAFATTQSLVVRQTAEGHQKLGEFLNELRLLLHLNQTTRMKDLSDQEPGEEPEIRAVSYSVADLLAPQPAIHLNQNQNSSENKVESKDTDKLNFDSLIELITTTVSPDSWEDVGGPGTISAFEPTKSLVIRQTQQVHEEIAALFDQLRQLRRRQVTLQIIPLYVTDEQYRQHLRFLPATLGEKNSTTLTAEQTKSIQKLALKLNPQRPGTDSKIKTTSGFLTHEPILGNQTEPFTFKKPSQQTTLVMVSNGQILHTSIPYQTIERQTQYAWVQLQSLVSGDRRFVRVTLKVKTKNKQTPLAGAVTETIPDRRPMLFDLSDQLHFVGRSDTVVTDQPREDSQETKANRTINGRLLITVYPRVVVEEEEEVLADPR